MVGLGASVVSGMYVLHWSLVGIYAEASPVKVALETIRSGFSGFEQLIELYHLIKEQSVPELEIDMSRVSWLDANMCAALGAVLFQVSEVSKIVLLQMKPNIEDILQKNGFLPNFGFDREKKPDVFGTTIEYQQFVRMDSAKFKEYVARHFVGKGIPDMTLALHRKFRESISEVFENAIDHSHTQHGIFACGQFFPKKNRLDFSIADLGIGFQRNILCKRGLTLSPEEAIQWAMDAENTTRDPKEGKPGGLGLKLIREFIGLNDGRIQVVSDAGYWCSKGGQVEKKLFSVPFPGTVVTIEINTADAKTYYLASEVDPESIF